MEQAENQHKESPLMLDVQDLEREIERLKTSNEEIRAFAQSEDAASGADLRLVVVENEFAIEAKIKRINELRATLGLSPTTTKGVEPSVPVSAECHAPPKPRRVPVPIAALSSSEEGLHL